MPNPELLLSELRKDLSDIDKTLIELIAQRQQKILEIGKVKKTLAHPVFDPRREQEQYRYYDMLAGQFHVDKALIAALFGLLIAESRKLQEADPHPSK